MTFETKINDWIKAARKEGYIEGYIEEYTKAYTNGYTEALMSLVNKGLISVEIAAEKGGMSVEEFVQKMDSVSAFDNEGASNDK